MDVRVCACSRMFLSTKVYEKHAQVAMSILIVQIVVSKQLFPENKPELIGKLANDQFYYCGREHMKWT